MDRSDDEEFVRWARKVKVRDRFMCQLCHHVGYVEAHHKNAYASFPEERTDEDNGVTLCKIHHDLFHQMYGKGKNTKWQWDQFVEIYNSLKNIAEKEIQGTNDEL